MCLFLLLLATMVFSSRVANCYAQKNASDNLTAATPTSLVDAAETGDWEAVSRRILAGDDVNQAQPDGMTSLHWAVFQAENDRVNELLDAGAMVDAETVYQIRPIHIACQSGNAEIASILLRHGADANVKLPGGETVLMTAARNGNATIVNELIAKGAHVNAKERRGQTALMWAAAAGNLQAVDVLVRSDADIDHTLKSGFSAFLFAARQGRTDVALRLIEAGVDVNTVMNPANTNGRNPRNGMSALLLAVENGHFELALRLIEKGADPNDQRSGFAPLHAISWVRKTNVGDNPDGDPPPRGSGTLTSLQFVEKIVSAGADVNLQLTAGSGGRALLNRQGATPFLMAAKTADVPLLNLFLKLGANPSIPNDEDCTPLMAAAGIGVIAVGEEPGSVAEVEEVIRMLVKLGADLDHVDKNGETAMHGAAYRNYPETVRLLSILGADPSVWNRKNNYGWTPVMIASGKRPGSFKPSPETIDALRDAIASHKTKTDAESLRVIK